MSEAAQSVPMTPGRRLRSWANMLFVDHGILRITWTARAPVAPGLVRSNQPMPFQLRRAARAGTRTIVNLRGARSCGSYVLEEDACRRLGLTLVNFPVNSRDAPKKETIHGAAALFRGMAYPALMHCKSGADRVGLMSVLYLMLEKGEPVERALRHLSWRYGHFRQAKTGILDFFFESYRDYNAKTPIAFMDWVDTVYDPKALKSAFLSKWWANVLVDRLLSRE